MLKKITIERKLTTAERKLLCSAGINPRNIVAVDWTEKSGRRMVSYKKITIRKFGKFIYPEEECVYIGDKLI